jgi:hypothetical protein
MRRHGIRAIMARPRRMRTTDSRHEFPIASNLLERNFIAAAPSQVWLADIMGVDYASLPRATTDGNPRNLLKGAAEAMVAYTTNEPFIFEKLGTPYLIFSPRAFGFDFYGDNLCTSKEQVAKHPERVREFREASLKGWAMRSRTRRKS